MEHSKYKNLINWKAQKSSFVVLFLTVLAISSIAYVHLKHEYDYQIKQIREQGFAKVRMLSQISYDQLVQNNQENRIFALTEYNLRDPNFAYSAVTNLNGYTEITAKRPDVDIPYLKPPADPSGWLGIKKIDVPPYGTKLMDFHAPVFSDGKHKGFFRIGYYEPSFNITFSSLPTIAIELLPILLIITLSVYLLRRNSKSIEQIGSRINSSIKQNNLNDIKISANGELSEFVSNFNEFMSGVRHRISSLNESNRDLEATSKLLTYQQSKIVSVLHALPEGMIVFDDSGNISFVNAKVPALFGVDNDGSLDSDFSWCANKKVKTFLLKIKNNTLGNYVNESIEFSPESIPDRTYVVNAYPLYSNKEHHAVQGTMVLFRDTTEESLAKSARGEFIAHVAHELKNPLNVLAMYSESLLHEEGEKYEFRVEAVNVIQDEVDRLSSLITNLLNITKIEMGSLEVERQRTKLKDLLEDIYETMKRGENHKNIKLVLDVPNEIPSLYIDKDLIRIAINNLLTNAIKYSNEGGTVTLSVEEVDHQINLRVRDEGIGIAANEQALIFDRFYRSENEDVRSRVGHGLGLSLVRDIVHLHNGKVSLNSEINKGTEFIITLENNMEMLGKAV